jgi:hypothetical protein
MGSKLRRYWKSQRSGDEGKSVTMMWVVWGVRNWLAKRIGLGLRGGGGGEGMIPAPVTGVWVGLMERVHEQVEKRLPIIVGVLVGNK